MANPKRSAGPRSVPKTNRKGRKKRSLWVRIPLWILSILLIVGVIGAGAVAYAYSTIKLPDPNSDFKTNTTFVYYNDGKTKLGSFQVQNRQSISYDQMPQYVKDAIVAAENRTFWTDPGVSATGLFRAGLGLVGLAPADVTASGGGSTITQQYIKIMYLTSEKSFSRKAKELLLAAKMGQTLSKQDILEGYLNTVYFGRGAYGVEAAAQAYFKKSASSLNLAQSVALAAIVNSPGNLDPANGKQQAADLLQRYQYTLNGMVDTNAITSAQRAEIYDKLPKFPKRVQDSTYGGPKGFLLTAVKNELLAKGFSESEINGGGLKVVTTFDSTLTGRGRVRGDRSSPCRRPEGTRRRRSSCMRAWPRSTMRPEACSPCTAGPISWPTSGTGRRTRVRPDRRSRPTRSRRRWPTAGASTTRSTATPSPQRAIPCRSTMPTATSDGSRCRTP